MSLVSSRYVAIPFSSRKKLVSDGVSLTGRCLGGDPSNPLSLQERGSDSTVMVSRLASGLPSKPRLLIYQVGLNVVGVVIDAK